MIVRRRPEEVGLWVEMKTRADLGSAGVSRGLVDADLGPAGVDLSKDGASCLHGYVSCLNAVDVSCLRGRCVMPA